MSDIISCKNCGAVNSYTVERKANNDVASCSKCGKYIKNLPHATPALYVGKYKEIPIKEVFDLDYLRWARKTLTLSENVRGAIQAQIQRLEEEAK